MAGPLCWVDKMTRELDRVLQVERDHGELQKKMQALEAAGAGGAEVTATAANGNGNGGGGGGSGGASDPGSDDAEEESEKPRRGWFGL